MNEDDTLANGREWRQNNTRLSDGFILMASDRKN